MIIPDLNLLIYAYDSNSLHHSNAANWWQECMNGTEPVGIPAPVAFGFVRLTTHARVFQSPLGVAEATRQVNSWLEQPNVQYLAVEKEHLARAFALLEQLGTAGNLTTDAQLAALAIENEATLHTADTDFARFPGLRCANPLSRRRLAQ